MGNRDDDCQREGQAVGKLAMKKITFRKISTDLWRQPTYRRLLPNAKLIYLYLMTNSCTTACGIYIIELAEICFFCGLNATQVRDGMATLETSGLARFSPEYSEVAISSWLDDHPPENPNQKTAIRREIIAVNDHALIDFVRGLGELSNESGSAPKAEKNRPQPEKKPREAKSKGLPNPLITDSVSSLPPPTGGEGKSEKETNNSDAEIAKLGDDILQAIPSLDPRAGTFSREKGGFFPGKKCVFI